MKLREISKFFICVILVSSVSWADELTYGGHLKLAHVNSRYPSDSFFGFPIPDSSDQSFINGRINSKFIDDGFEVVLEGTGGVQKNTGRVSTQFLALGVDTDDRTAVFDLSHLGDPEGTSFYGRIDRLSLNWLGDNTAFRVGRMALTWGQGTTFQVLDIVNPFPPATIDPEYKPGSDMVYAQTNIGSEMQVEAVLVPRRERESGDLTADESTLAIRMVKRFESAESELAITAAQHYGGALIGVGYNFPFNGAILRSDLLLRELDGYGSAFSALVNIDRSWILFDKNWYGTFEYFHSGIGAKSNQIEEFSEGLLAGLSQGDLFTVGRNYLSLGLRQEITPLFNFNQLLIQAIEPAGTLLQVRGTYDLAEDVVLLGAATVGLGDSSSEFQGYRQGGALIERGDSVFLQLGWFF